MTKPNRSYEPHLAVREVSLPPKGEWEPRLPGWSLCQVVSGAGYWLHPQLNQELEAGTVLFIAPHAQGSVRASQLGGLSLCFFNVEPERLTGLITLSEQRFVQAAASNEKFSLRILPPHSPVAMNMKGQCANRTGSGCLFRLQLLQLFIEVFGNELKQEVSRPEANSDAKERLREFLRQTPASDLLHMNFSVLGQMMRCTPRHLSRIFHDVVGMSFRDKHAELRLVRARELLATTESKVVDVALESGYQSLSLFNLMFARRFGMSPGKWRQKRRSNKVSTIRFAAGGKQSVCFSNGSALQAGKRAERW